MEHREPPRIGPADRRLEEMSDWPGAKRSWDALAGRRRFGASIAGVVLLAYFGGWAARSSVGWLSNQAPYQLPFDRIELVNPPPRWFLGGASRFLELVRQDLNEPENVAVLKVAPDEIAAVFMKFPWVEQVERVAFRAGQIRVELRYRQPVARVALRDKTEVVLDEEGTVLPAKDVDAVALGKVFKITEGLGLAPPVAQYGEKWKSGPPDDGREHADERILAAARLAGFVRRELSNIEGTPPAALQIDEIIITDFHNRGLFLTNYESSVIWWGDAPGFEKPDRLKADEKWTILERWARTAPARFMTSSEDYWQFWKNELRYICPHGRAKHSARATPTPRPVSQSASGSP
jgi:hypothetical protein